jgi:hypothetical protein
LKPLSQILTITFFFTHSDLNEKHVYKSLKVISKKFQTFINKFFKQWIFITKDFNLLNELRQKKLSIFEEMIITYYQ